MRVCQILILRPPPPGKDPALVVWNRSCTPPVRPYRGNGCERRWGAPTAPRRWRICRRRGAAREGAYDTAIWPLSPRHPAYAHVGVQRAFARAISPCLWMRGAVCRGTRLWSCCSARRSPARAAAAPELFRIAKTGLAGVSPPMRKNSKILSCAAGCWAARCLSPFPPEEKRPERVRAALIPPLAALRKGLTAHTAWRMTSIV